MFNKTSIKAALRRINQNKLLYLSYLLLGWFAFTFLILPYAYLIFDVIEKSSNLDGAQDPFTKLVTSPVAVPGIRNSIILAIILSVTVNILGIFIVLVTEVFDIKGSKILKIGYMTTFVYGGIIFVGGYIFLYGENGFATRFIQYIFPTFKGDWLTGLWGVVFVNTFGGTTGHILFLGNAIKSIDNNTVNASRNMGASVWYTIRKVILPVLLPTIFAVTTLVFMSGLGAFAAPLIIGGDFKTIAPLILVLSQNPAGKDTAILLSFILGIMTVGLIVVFKKFEGSVKYFSISKTKTEFKKIKIENSFANGVIHTIAYILLVMYVLPISLVILFSFTNGNAIANATITLSDFSIDLYKVALQSESFYVPFFNSVKYSLLASVLVLLLVMLATTIIRKYKNLFTKALEYVLLVPWMLPSILIAIALKITFSLPQAMTFGQVIGTSSLILVTGYVIVKIPYTSRLTKAAYSSIDDNYELASKNMGAGPFYTFRRVVFPLILPTALALLVLNFNGLLSDYNLSVFLAPITEKTLGILIRENTSADAIGDTQAKLFVYSTIRIFISIVTITFVYGWLLKKSRQKLWGE